MLRRQLYLPDSLCKLADQEAKKNKTSFASVVRMSLEKTLVKKSSMTLQELKVRFPILKFSGIVKGKSGEIENNNIDDFLYGIEQEK